MRPTTLPAAVLLAFSLALFATAAPAGAAADAAVGKPGTDAKPTPARAARPPNVVFFLADDLGFGDIGPFGQTKIKTPNLDRLAAEGMKLARHYAGNNVCAPSRSVFMTGLHPGHTYIRDNKEMTAVYGEGQFPVPPNALTLPLTFKAAGYTTGAFGKWGLGAPTTTGVPEKQGIDRFYGYNCQAVAHNYYPTYLWDHDKKVPLDNPAFKPQQKLPEGADANDPASYAGYVGKQYAPDLINAKCREWARANAAKPFFLFVPTTVPHLALQVPPEEVAAYAGAFPEQPYPGGRGYLPNRTPLATYAAMVTRMDKEIGRLMDLVKELGLDEDTIFVFASDNGPLYNKLGGTDTDFFNSAAGLRGRKGSMYEGGVHVPCVVRWPGHVAPGTTSDRVSGFEDWLPTFAELAGIADKVPADKAKALDGISLAPTLLGKPQPPRPFLYRECSGGGGTQLARVGDWKAVRTKLNPGPKQKLNAGPIELYDLATDPTESKDVAAEHPEVVKKLAALMAEQHVKSADFPMRALDGDVVPKGADDAAPKAGD
jgi:arylsulfatase A